MCSVGGPLVWFANCIGVDFLWEPLWWVLTYRHVSWAAWVWWGASFRTLFVGLWAYVSFRRCIARTQSAHRFRPGSVLGSHKAVLKNAYGKLP
nr:MAG TPA: hypothetical protein [Caudoviricetes sp.]